jgi:hypothetical protein
MLNFRQLLDFGGDSGNSGDKPENASDINAFSAYRVSPLLLSLW